MIRKKMVMLMSILIILSSCSSTNLLKYYYPIDNEVKVYKYINPTNPEKTEYWKITTSSISGNLLTESYTSNFLLYNTFEEKVHSNYAELISYTDS